MLLRRATARPSAWSTCDRARTPTAPTRTGRDRRPRRPRATGARPPRGDPGRRRVQHAAAADALRHRAARRSSSGTASRCGSTCRESGENLQDRYEVGVVSRDGATTSRCSRARRSGRRRRETARPLLREWQRRQGRLHHQRRRRSAIIKRSRPELPDPDLFIFGLPADFRGYYPGYSEAPRAEPRHFTWAMLKAHTQQQGRHGSRLRSADPRDIPDDRLPLLRRGRRRRRRRISTRWSTASSSCAAIMNARLGDVIAEELCPAPRSTRRDEICGSSSRRGLGPPRLLHLPDRAGRATRWRCVDSDFRVHGARRACGSSTRRSSRASPASSSSPPIYMVSEKASDVIHRSSRPATAPTDSPAEAQPTAPPQARPGTVRAPMSPVTGRGPAPGSMHRSTASARRSTGQGRLGQAADATGASGVLVGVAQQAAPARTSVDTRSAALGQRADRRTAVRTRRSSTQPAAPTAATTTSTTPAMGMAGTRFGRNIPLDQIAAGGTRGRRCSEPNPREVSRRLLTRDEFIPAHGGQRAGRRLAAVHDPRLVQPRPSPTENPWDDRRSTDDDDLARATRCGSCARRTTRPGRPGRTRRRRRTVNALTALVGRLADLRQRRTRAGARAPGEDGKLRRRRRRPAADPRRPGARPRRRSPGFWLGLAHAADAVRPRAQRDLRPAARRPTRPGTTRSSSSARGWSTRRCSPRSTPSSGRRPSSATRRP